LETAGILGALSGSGGGLQPTSIVRNKAVRINLNIVSHHSIGSRSSAHDRQSY